MSTESKTKKQGATLEEAMQKMQEAKAKKEAEIEKKQEQSALLEEGLVQDVILKKGTPNNMGVSDVVESRPTQLTPTFTRIKRGGESSNNAKNVEDLFGDDMPYNSAEYLEFIKFLATPKEMRKFKTQGQFSKFYKISEATLSDWKKRKNFYNAVSLYTRMILREDTPAIMKRLRDNLLRSKRPNGRDTLVWLQYVEGFNPKLQMEMDTPEDNDTEMDAERRQQLAQAYLNNGLAEVEEAQILADDGLASDEKVIHTDL